MTTTAAALHRGRATGAGYQMAPDADQVAWELKGECNYHEPELWYSPLPGAIAAAKAICATCPVLEQCRDWALKQHEIYGVWGGLSEDDREVTWTGRRTKRVRRQRHKTLVELGVL